MIEILDEIDSTNDYLKRRINKNFDTVLAHKQTKGRGTRGRVWLSTEGVLMFSFVIKEEKNVSIEEYMKLPLIAGMALLEALKEVEDLDYMFKWTNDIYLEDKKLSGILMEKNDEDFIVGIGVNLNILEFGDLNAISLKSITGKNYDKVRVAEIIINKMKEFLFEFYRGNWKDILGKINSVNYLKNKNVKFFSPERVYEGIVREIGNEGELVLDEKGIIRKLKIGEVSTR